MYSLDNLELCAEVFKLHHIRLQLFSRPYANGPELDFGLRAALFPGYDYTALLERLRAMLTPGEILYLQDGFGVSYNVFSLEGGPEAASWEMGVLGPWRREMPSPQAVQALVERYDLPAGSEAAIQLYLGRVPENMAREEWVALCTRTIGRLITPDGNVKFFVPGSQFLELPDLLDEERAEKWPVRDYAEQSLQGGYLQETEMLNALKKGNFSQAADMANKYVNFQMNYRRQFQAPLEAIPVELNALFRHAAQEAGVNALRLDETYIKYCRLTAASDQGDLYLVMLREYCDLVEQFSTRNCSPVVRECLDTIDFFYYRPINLQQLAARSAVSKQYLCTRFRKEVGMTVVEYLNKVRVGHARQLLRDKRHSIEEISEACGFSDSSYFSRVFKQHTGRSPKRYRDDHLLT